MKKSKIKKVLGPYVLLRAEEKKITNSKLVLPQQVDKSKLDNYITEFKVLDISEDIPEPKIKVGDKVQIKTYHQKECPVIISQKDDLTVGEFLINYQDIVAIIE